MNGELKIVKARVEQDKYATVELKIIKAGGKIPKDLYIEKEIPGGEYYVVSDNVLVALHRTLRNGEVPNLEIVSKNGDILTDSIYSKIEYYDNDLFVCVKSESNMISVKNNQNTKKDPFKVQEIAEDSRNIKEQMNEFMTKTNPSSSSLRFIFDDAYNEASVFHMTKENGIYKANIVADKASFVAFDGINLYSHSNIVTDETKVMPILAPTVREQNIVAPSVSVVPEESKEIKYSKEFIPKTPAEIKAEDKKENSIKFSKDFIPGKKAGEKKDNVVKFSKDFIISKNVNENKKSEKKASKDFIPKPLEEVSVPVTELPDGGVEKQKEANVTFDNFFKIDSEPQTEPVKEEKNEEIELEFEDNDDFDKLSEMINKLIEREKNSKEVITGLNEQIDDLNRKLAKKDEELDNKTKKVNTLINDNRKYIDENRNLRSRVNNLEEDNSKYMSENERLKEEARSGKDKINAVISSIGEVLDSYDDKVLVKKAA